MARPRLEVVDWGITEYGDAVRRQQELVAGRIQGRHGDLLVFTEHLPVYTLGAHPGSERHLVWTQAEREAKGIAVHASSRGGDVTHHAPGQLVGYPIVDLSATRDLHAHLRWIEDSLLTALAGMGLDCGRRAGKTGAWIGTRKIAAIGVAVRGWVSYHGFAINVTNDLSLFDGIVPCGITDGSVTSLARELGDACPGMDRVKIAVAEAFGAVLP